MGLNQLAGARINNLMEETGIRLTNQRENVIQVIIENRDEHLAVADIYSLAKERDKTIGMATVYRTLDLLENLGVVKKRNFGDESAKYEFDLKEKNKHHHLICESCGRVIEVSDLLSVDIVNQTSQQKDFEVIDYCVQIYGYCNQCRDNKNSC